MNLVEFLRLMHRHLRLLVTVPMVIALVVGIMVMRKPSQFRSEAMIHTGLVSSINVLDVQDSRVDYFAVNSSFDNLISVLRSRETMRKTGLRLIAGLVADGRMSAEDGAVQAVRDVFTQDILTAWGLGSDADSNLVILRTRAEEQPMRSLLADDSSPFSVKRLTDNLQAKRIGASDMLEVSYTADHPEHARRTLEVLIGIFMEDYKAMKSSQAGSMVAFFEEEVRKAADLLKRKSDELRSFRIANGIINYEEQTEQLTVQQGYVETEYRDELRTLSASEAALADLNIKLGNRAEIILRNEEVLRLQDELTERVRSISAGRLSTDSVNAAPARTGSAERLRTALTSAVESAYVAGRTVEGLSKAELLRQWLRSYLQVIEGRARVDVLRERIAAYKGEVDTYAPLGSSLRSMERDIDVAEREYLELLHSLNVSRLREQNLEMSSQIRVVDAPVLPVRPESSKGIIMIGGSWVLGLFLVIALIIGAEYLDRSVSTPERVAEATGLPLIGALPDITSIEAFNGRETLMEQLARNIVLELELEGRVNGSGSIVVASTRANEGKTTLLQELHARIPALTPGFVTRHAGDADVVSLRERPRKRATGKPRRTDLELIEIEPLVSSMLPLGTLETANLILLIVRSDRAWTTADKRAVDLLMRIAKGRIAVVLNGITSDRSEELIGEIAKPRTSVRKLVKRLASFEFTSSFTRRAA